MKMIDLNDEKKLVEAAKKDLNKFGEVYDLYVKKIYSYVAYLVGNSQAAEDIVSETFEKAMLNIDKFEYRGYSFGAWLYTIARNLVYDKSKSKKTLSLDEIETFIGSKEDDPEDLYEKKNNSDYLKSILLTLNDEQREIVYLRYIQDYSIKEVCKMTGRSEDSVKSLCKRALSKLKENYGKNK